jgi:hypothetical protein
MFRTYWIEHTSNIRQVVKETKDVPLYYYSELPLDGTVWLSDYKGDPYISRLYTIPHGSGDGGSPSLYVLPNLEVLGKTAEDHGVEDTLPWLSYHWTWGYTNTWSSSYPEMRKAFLYFNETVSREAGRMLRRGGAKGFYIWPNPLAEGYWSEYGTMSNEYWLGHLRELIAGFREGLNYKETNKIPNGNFEAYKTVSPLGGPPEQIQFYPVFWVWSDSVPEYTDDNISFSHITTEKHEGSSGWQHTRTGIPGNRTIQSHEFSISYNESGEYTLNLWTKADSTSMNGNVWVSMVDENNQNEIDIGQTPLQTSWNEFSRMIELGPGTFSLKIVLEDNTNQHLNIWLDAISLRHT